MGYSCMPDLRYAREVKKQDVEHKIPSRTLLKNRKKENQIQLTSNN